MSVMRSAVLAAAVVFLFPVFSGNATAADTPKNVAFGARLATTLDDDDGDFEQYEVFGAFHLPWMARISNGWQLESMLDVSLGALDGGDDSAGKFAAGVDLFWYSPGRALSFVAGLGAGVMTEDGIGEVDFGGPVFFRFQGGVSYWFNPPYSVGYKFLHESNGSMYDKNPSLNMHQFEFRLHF